MQRIVKVRRTACADTPIEGLDMVAQPLEEFLTPQFLAAAAATLAELGFIVDEHDFAPYRETLNTHHLAIQQALAAHGNSITLVPGFVNHGRAGFAYFIYDSGRFDDQSIASTAVAAWLDQRYLDE